MDMRADMRSAGVLGLATAGLLGASLAFGQGGPPADHPNAVLAWLADQAVAIRVSALLWLLAMLGLVVFAVRIREALWTTTFDRSWLTVLFVQGAGVFATIAVVAAAITWGLADQAAAGAVNAELASTVWALQQILLRFATWGFTVPLVVVGAALYRYSVMGQVCAAAAILVAIALLIPLTWHAALYAFCVWLALAGLTLLIGSRPKARHPQLVP
jgi:hypothetical protein